MHTNPPHTISPHHQQLEATHKDISRILSSLVWQPEKNDVNQQTQNISFMDIPASNQPPTTTEVKTPSLPHINKLLHSRTHPDTNDNNVQIHTRLTRCKPWDKQDFIARVNTFTLQRWFCKPLLLSPLECARYGWCCSDRTNESDYLYCPICHVKLYCKFLPTLSEQGTLALAKDYHSQLKNAHKTLCPWYSGDTQMNNRNNDPTRTTKDLSHTNINSNTDSDVQSDNDINVCPPHFSSLPATDSTIDISTVINTYSQIRANIQQYPLPVVTPQCVNTVLEQGVEYYISFLTAANNNKNTPYDSIPIPSHEQATTFLRSLLSDIDILAILGWNKHTNDKNSTVNSGNSSHTLMCTFCTRAIDLRAYQLTPIPIPTPLHSPPISTHAETLPNTRPHKRHRDTDTDTDKDNHMSDSSHNDDNRTEPNKRLHADNVQEMDIANDSDYDMELTSHTNSNNTDMSMEEQRHIYNFTHNNDTVGTQLFDALKEHRYFCPYIAPLTLQTVENDQNHSQQENVYKFGWHRVLQVILAHHIIQIISNNNLQKQGTLHPNDTNSNILRKFSHSILQAVSSVYHIHTLTHKHTHDDTYTYLNHVLSDVRKMLLLAE